jgi:hypothetical protein
MATDETAKPRSGLLVLVLALAVVFFFRRYLILMGAR